MIERISLDKLQKLIDYYGLRSKTAYTSTNAPKTATQINTSLHISSSWDSIYLGGCTFAIYTPGGTETICRVSAHSDADVGKLYCEIPILPSDPQKYDYRTYNFDSRACSQSLLLVKGYYDGYLSN